MPLDKKISVGKKGSKKKFSKRKTSAKKCANNKGRKKVDKENSREVFPKIAKRTNGEIFVVVLEGKKMLVLWTESWTDFIEQVGSNEFDNQDKGLYYTIAGVTD